MLLQDIISTDIYSFKHFKNLFQWSPNISQKFLFNKFTDSVSQQQSEFCIKTKERDETWIFQGTETGKSQFSSFLNFI